MNGSSLVMMGKEEYEQILRSVIAFDHIRARNAGRSADQVTPLQQRLLDEAERFGVHWSDEERDRFADWCLGEVDSFVNGEAWDELAWWIAEREYSRRTPRLGGARRGDADAKDLITHRYYHEAMDEFQRHGIAHLEIPDLRFTEVSPETVRAALTQFKKETARGAP